MKVQLSASEVAFANTASGPARTVAADLDCAAERLLVEDFAVLAEVAGSPQKLRLLILTLAVTGRLSVRLATDGDAATLLAKLDAEQDATGAKARAVGEDEVSGPATIPASWQWARFLRVASIDSHLVDPGEFRDLPHVAPDNIEKGTGRLLEYRTIREDGVTSSKHRFFAGQIVYSKIRPNLSRAVVVDFEGLCSADMYPLTARIDRRFFHCFLLSPVFLVQVVKGDNRLAMPKVNQEQLGATVVPVPPLAEQKRIVARVDQLMALIDDLEAKQAKKRDLSTRFTKASLEALTTVESPEDFDTAWQRASTNFAIVIDRAENVTDLRNAILEMAFTGRLVPRLPSDSAVSELVVAVDRGWRFLSRKEALPPVATDEVRVGPSHWTWLRLGNLSEVVGGVAKGRDLKGRKRISLPYLRVANVQRGFLDLEQMKQIEIGEDEQPKYLLMAGDVLFTEGGDWDKFGRSAVWANQIDPCIHQNHVFRARLVCSELDPAWVSSYANSPVGRRYFESAAKRTTNLASINMRQLRNCPIPLPPAEEKARIVAKVEQLMSKTSLAPVVI